jgi:transcriptional regulator with XRE-family HTH domain
MEARNLPDALRLIMEQRGWTQLDLARELGISQPFVSNLLSGKRETGFTKAIQFFDRVDWQVRISPKSEDDDPVKRREFVTAAASVAFVPSSTVGPYQDPSYLRVLARRTARDRYERGAGARLAR